MFQWYQNARICYAYLADFCMRDELLMGSPIDEQTFRESRWFTRGWTLQELLAPGNVEFYDKNWHYYGSKSSLKDQISLITGFQQGHMFDISGASAAQKMSWASGRKTTRLEDIAYSLMGIFDVSMPLLYGEGRKAFIRLQHEIVKISDDESIFAWMDGELLESGVFAQTPHAFAESGDVVQIIDGHRLYVRRAPYAVTNRGLAIEIFASEKHEAAIISDQGFSFLPLNCGRQPESGAGPVQWLVDIELKRISRDDFVRSSPGKLNPAVWPINVNCTRLVYVRPVYVLYEPHEQRRSLFINASSLWKRGLTISSAYG